MKSFFSLCLCLIASIALGQTPGQVIDQKFEQQQQLLDQLQMQVMDLQTRVNALENPTPPITTQLVTGTNLHLVGGFRVPAGVIDGVNTSYLSGAFDRMNGKWIANHSGVNDRIIEYIEPGDMGTGDPFQWPLLTLGRNGQPFLSVDKIGPAGVFWLGADRVLCSGRKGYRSGFEPNWMCEFNLSDGTESLIPLANPAFDENENFHLHQSFGGGFCRIPQSYADVHTDGRVIGLGRGGYDVSGSPLGPALAAWRQTDQYPSEVLIDYPFSRTGAIARDTDYVVPPNGEVTDWLHSPVDGVGKWQSGNSSTPAWVDHPQFRGILFCTVQVRGTIDYRAQGDGGSGIMFAVTDPTVFYSANSSGANRGGHEEEVENQTLPPAHYARVLYVYDPENLNAEPARYEFPLEGISLSDHYKQPSVVKGLFWDNERQLLWACISNVHTDQKYAILAAFELGIE